MALANQRYFDDVSAWKKRMLEASASEIVDLVEKDLKLLDDSAQNAATITNMAAAAPSINSALDKKTGVAHACAMLFLQHVKGLSSDAQDSKSAADDSDIVNRKHAYILWGQALRRLRVVIHQRLADAKSCETEDISAFARLRSEQPDVHLAEWLLQKDRKRGIISDAVRNPKPEPVEMAHPSELVPLLSFLESGVEESVGVDGCSFGRGGTLYPDGRLDLCKQALGESASNVLEAMLAQNGQNVRHLLLGNNLSGDAGASAIANFLDSQQKQVALYGPSAARGAHVKTWYLGGNLFGPDQIRRILQALVPDRFAETVWFKRNPIMPEGGKYVADFLRANHPTVRVCDLDNVGLLDQGVAYVMQGARQNRVLTDMYLNGNGITEVGARAVADYFVHKAKANGTYKYTWLEWFLNLPTIIRRMLWPEAESGLTSLWLGVNQLDDAGIEFLMDALQHYPRLEKLCLSSNRFGTRAAAAIERHLSGQPRLVYLGLGVNKSTSDLGELPNCIGDEGAAHIARFVDATPQLRILDVAENNITRVGMGHLRRAILSHTHLVHFNQTRFASQSDLTGEIDAHLDANALRHYEMPRKAFLGSLAYKHLRHNAFITHIESSTRNQKKK